MAHDERAMHQPVTSSRAPLPVLRAAVFAAVGTLLGTSAHHLLSPGPPPWAQGAAAGAVLFGLGLAGARRPRRAATVVVCGVAGQSGLHLWLTLTAHPRPLERAHAPHHGPASAPVRAGAGVPRDPGPPWQERLHHSVAMTVAHALVAVLVAVLLHRADAACWALAREVTTVCGTVRGRLAVARALVAGRAAAPAGAGVQLLLPTERERRPAMSRILADAVIRRGPPPAVAAPLVN